MTLQFAVFGITAVQLVSYHETIQEGVKMCWASTATTVDTIKQVIS